jgi:cyclophilin family peptidyl-prolyl cis-trans isomerase
MKFIFVALLLSVTQVWAASPVVVMETSYGVIEIELNEEKAPITVKNFLEYVDAKFYDGTIFHRVIPSFMIQGGGFDEKLVEKKTRAPIKNEASNGLQNTEGSIAMARTSDPHSATAQFFINTAENGSLNYRGEANPGYAVFGKVISGMPVVNRIKMVRTTRVNGMDDVPGDAVLIKSVKRKK